MRYMGSLIVAGMLVGCSNITLRTNLGDYAISQARQASVDELSIQDLQYYQPKVLGNVTASECVARRESVTLVKDKLIQRLKVRAGAKGANAIFVDHCGSVVQGQCQSAMQCRATAYQVDYGVDTAAG